MGLRSVDFVVLPPQTLYKARELVENLTKPANRVTNLSDTQASPLFLVENFQSPGFWVEEVLGNRFQHALWEHYMACRALEGSFRQRREKVLELPVFIVVVRVTRRKECQRLQS